MKKEILLSDPLYNLNVSELSKLLREFDVSPVEILDSCFNRIEEINEKILGFLTLAKDEAYQQAKKAEKEIMEKQYLGPLHGIPFGVKDIIDTKGILTTRGSSVFKDNIPNKDAFCISKLKDAGAVMLGKCHTQEFASGPLSYNPYFGTVKNPWDTSRTTGGSSSGSAASVSSRMCPFALGTDTGSSIRGPSALCGIVGLKPTHGRVSLNGVCPNTLSFDHVGPMTRSVVDAAMILEAMSGYDSLDPYSKIMKSSEFSSDMKEGIEGMKIGLCPDLYSNHEVDNEILSAFDKMIRYFENNGVTVETLEINSMERIQEIIDVILSAEFLEFHLPIYKEHSEGYGEIAKEAVENRIGKIGPEQLIAAYRERELLKREVLNLFNNVDVIMAPSLPCISPRIDNWKSSINGREIDYNSPITKPFLTPHNFTGSPAIVVPIGLSSEGLPMSMQIIGDMWKESSVLRFAYALEEENLLNLEGKLPPC